MNQKSENRSPISEMLTSKKIKILIPIVVSISLFVFSYWLYADHHAFGAYRGDSPGYIHLAAKIYNQEKLIYVDALEKKAFEYFGDEKLSRWIIPNHHQFINNDGLHASKYPLGLPLLLALTAFLSGSLKKMYILNPILSSGIVVLTYVLSISLFPRHKLRHLIGLFSAIAIGSGTIFYNYATAQPMREIPSLFFILLATMTLLWSNAASLKNNKITRGLLLFACGASLGMAINIRETSLMVLPAFIFYQTYNFIKNKKNNFKANLWRQGLLILGLLIFLTPTIFNAITISSNKEVIRKKDLDIVYIFPNTDHINSLSFSHIFTSEGKFNPGMGSLPYYWQTLKNNNPLPFMFIFLFMGVLFLWKRSKSKTLLLGLWWIGILFIFCLWINPYNRYILPLLPPVIILSMYGFFILIDDLTKNKKYLNIICILSGIIFLGLNIYPNFQHVYYHTLADTPMYKSITEADLNNLERIGLEIKNENSILMLSGYWKSGISEMIEAHSGIKTIRFPYEQKHEFDEEKLDSFLNELVEENNLYIWIDNTSSAQAYEWLKNYNQETILAQDFSFQEWVRIIKVSGL